DIPYGHRGNLPAEPSPVQTAIERQKQPELRSNEKEIGADRILADDVRIPSDRVGGERRPGFAEIGGTIDVCAHIPHRMTIERRVGGRAVESSRLDTTAPRVRRQPRNVRGDVSPATAAVL